LADLLKGFFFSETRMPKQRKVVDEIGLFITLPLSLWAGDRLVVSGAALRLWCALRYWNHTRPAGTFPNREQLMALTDIGHKDTLSGAIRELTRDGWLEVRRGFQVCEYVLKVPAIRPENGTDTSVPEAGPMTTQKRDRWGPKNGTDGSAHVYELSLEKEKSKERSLSTQRGAQPNGERGSVFDLEVCIEYARSLPNTRSPAGLGQTIWRNGSADPDIETWLTRRIETDEERYARIARSIRAT
jgi:hypothetical protein